MKAQVIATRYPQLDENGDRHRRDRGEIIDVDQTAFDRGVAIGALREPSSAPLPEPNVAAAVAEGTVPAATQPDGTPLELEAVVDSTEFKKPRSHAEADKLAAELNVALPADAKLPAKVDALRQIVAARAAGDPQPDAPTSTENLADLSDAELIQRGVDSPTTNSSRSSLRR